MPELLFKQARDAFATGDTETARRRHIAAHLKAGLPVDWLDGLHYETTFNAAVADLDEKAVIKILAG